ncbi:GntR family transcriptional regulator [Clostridium sp.]|uniref:GntR family transcriptional regulator n=1 Tax=Clostridium sp. TaxID=1506 RepID=UPI001A57BEC9|nr:GntR family transcriptional regulator [Clostridium sp.]MBK5239896.1 GntR family transcriptional regulator [Clostridium sp.]
MNDFTPKYVIIQNYIIDKISQGDFVIGDKLPSENELSVMFNVSRVTSNKAVSELNILGIVERIRGKGTFVKFTNEDFLGMKHTLSKSSKISSEISEFRNHKVVSIEFMNANESIIKKLNLKEGEEVCKITREMVDLKETIAIDYSYIPASIINGSIHNEENLSNYYLHEYLKNILNLNPKYLHIHIDAKFPSKFEMNMLNVPKDRPLISWESNIIGEKNEIIAYTVTIAKADKYKPFINFELT